MHKGAVLIVRILLEVIIIKQEFKAGARYQEKLQYMKSLHQKKQIFKV